MRWALGPESRPRPRANGGNGAAGWPPDDEMEARIAKLEVSVAHMERDISQMRPDLANVRERLATLEERVSHLPSKSYMAKNTLLVLAVIAALVAFSERLQALVAAAS